MSRRVRRKKRQSRFDMFVVVSVLFIMLILVSVGGKDLQDKQDVYAMQKIELEAQIAEQEARAEELEELKKYVQTDSYVEEVAQEKLGLVHNNEILFKLQK